MNPLIQSMLKEAIQAFENGHVDGANAILHRVLQVDINSADTIFELGVAYARANKFFEALTLFSSLRPYKESDARIPYNLGLIYSLQGKHQLAIAAYDAALAIKPNDVETLINKSSTCNDSNDFVLAVELLENAIQLNPEIPEAWSNKGIALNNLNLLQESLAAYNKAVELNPSYFEAWSNKSVVLNNLKRFSEASEASDRALSLNPNYAEAWSNKGFALHELKHYEEANACYDKALTLKPDYAEAWANKGNLLQNLKRYDVAIACYDKALFFKSEVSQTWSNKGIALHELKHYEEAIACYDRALTLKPDYAEAWANKGNAFYELKRYQEAIACYDKALTLKPDYAEAWANKGNALYDTAQILEARLCFEKGIHLKPNFYRARWGKLFSTIPVVQTGNENLNEIRATLSLELMQSSKWFIENYSNESHLAIGSIQPFYLAYQDFNNKELLNGYGKLCCALMNRWQESINQPDVINNRGGKIKLGIIGEQIRNHSVWNAITKGLVLNLDTSKFEIHIFHLGSTADEETFVARSKVASFTNHKSSLAEWANVVIEKKLDVLLYPEIGMDALTAQLACLRLAPIQISTWGHPQTTGLPTIDYYLSAELFENEYSQDVYTEKLIKLPNLGCHYYKPSLIPTKFNFESFGISIDQPILICPGTPFKYIPQHDWIFVEIVKRLKKCKLIFFNHMNTHLSDTLRMRLHEAFSNSGLVFSDYIVFIPWQTPEEFYGLMEGADVFLDTVGFSGFNTAMQAIDCALPIVTQEGEFMRGRLASGILKKIGMPELIADSDEEYIELAIKLALDKSFHNHITKKLIATRDVLFEDMEPIHYFEKFLLNEATQHI